MSPPEDDSDTAEIYVEVSLMYSPCVDKRGETLAD
jgi:hypothetical protein